jgi:hypothetical protein
MWASYYGRQYEVVVSAMHELKCDEGQTIITQ